MLRLRIVTGLAALTLALLPGATRADRVAAPELWFGGGFHDPEYHDGGMAVGRGGAGVLLKEHLSLGGCLQVDRDHWFWFGYAGVVLPAISGVEPFGRFYMGQRDDSGDTNTQWSAGVLFGIPSVRVYVEVFQLIEPNEDKGADVGLVF